MVTNMATLRDSLKVVGFRVGDEVFDDETDAIEASNGDGEVWSDCNDIEPLYDAKTVIARLIGQAEGEIGQTAIEMLPPRGEGPYPSSEVEKALATAKARHMGDR